MHGWFNKIAIITWHDLLTSKPQFLTPLCQLTSGSWQSIRLVLLNWQLSHSGSSHTAPVSYVPEQFRNPLSSWISGSLTPHGHGTEATWPISVSGHVTGPTLLQDDSCSLGQPSYIAGKSRWFSLIHLPIYLYCQQTCIQKIYNYLLLGY